MEISKVLESIFIGILIAAIPGPIFFELIRRVITKGLLNGIILVIGEFTGNTILLFLIFIGVSSFFTHPVIKIVLYLLGSIILLKLGWSAILLKKEEVEKLYAMDEKKYGKSFITGFSIAVTSPIVIALWISLAGSYLSRFHNSFLAYFHIFLITFGFLFFFIPFGIIIYFIRQKISARNVILLSKIFGAVLVGYSCYFLISFIKSIALNLV